MATTQAKRAIQVKTPLGKDALLLQSMAGTERISDLYALELAFLSEKGNLDPDKILGADLTVSFDCNGGKAKRFFHGYVTEFAQTGYLTHFHQYRATVRPWLWFLTRAADCRIFQQKSVPDIFEAVVKDYGIANYKLKLKGTYDPLEYCVQYRETDFDFISRLLEHEGICYYFEHSDGAHVMVLSDDPSGHTTREGYKSVPYYEPGGPQAQRQRDHLSDWAFSKRVQSGAYATTDFDFEKPGNSLLATATVSRKHVRSDYEMFDYPAGLAKPVLGSSKRVAQLRVDELQAAHMVAHGHGDAAGLAPGFRFELEEFPRADLNIEYLVTEAEYALRSGTLGGDYDGGDVFEARIAAIDARTKFRPPRTTAKPAVRGSQTAIVVGKSGEEIYTDKYGRVKVQFHWDREGQRNENSSCWVRVAQPWTGKGWGAIAIPRVGQEVVVSFLEGDPDQPIITGSVYNGDDLPPYTLPDAATQSGIKTRSTPKGADATFNEIRFEDKKGEEEVYIHAEKNLKVVVENDQTITIGKEKKDKGSRTTDIQEDDTLKIGHQRTVEIADNDTLKVKGERSAKIDKDASTDVGKTYKLKAGDSITLECGAAKIVLKKSGDIEISGKNIKLNGQAKIEQSANQKVTIDGMQVKISGTQVGVEGQKTEVKGTLLDLNASGIASLKGSLTKIG